jgi:hypothetical protein
MKTAQFHRARLAVTGAVLLLAAAAVAASAALGASTSGPKLRISSTAVVGGSGSKLTVRGSISCSPRRFFAINVIAVQPSTAASLHGNDPGAGAHAPACTPTRKSFKIVADETGEKKPQTLKSGQVRVCFIIRGFGPGVPVTLDAQCATLRAKH